MEKQYPFYGLDNSRRGTIEVTYRVARRPMSIMFLLFHFQSMDFLEWLESIGFAKSSGGGVQIASMGFEEMHFLQFLFVHRQTLQERINIRRRKHFTQILL